MAEALTLEIFSDLIASRPWALVASIIGALFSLPPAEGSDLRPPGTVRVAGIVLKWVEGDLQANYQRAEHLIRQAAAHGAQIVATPESFLDGYAVRNPELGKEQLRALAEPIPEGRFFKRLQRLADELDIHLIAGITELEGEEVFNSAVLLGPDGAPLGTYRKKYLWPGEAHLYSHGKEMRVFETPHGDVGIMICFDRMQGAAIEELAERGADLVFNPSGGSWGPESDAVMSQRSRDGGVPIVFVHPVEFLVTAPDGSVLASEVHGAELDDPAHRDIGTVAYFDLPLD